MLWSANEEKTLNFFSHLDIFSTWNLYCDLAVNRVEINLYRVNTPWNYHCLRACCELDSEGLLYWLIFVNFFLSLSSGEILDVGVHQLLCLSTSVIWREPAAQIFYNEQLETTSKSPVWDCSNKCDFDFIFLSCCIRFVWAQAREGALY